MKLGRSIIVLVVGLAVWFVPLLAVTAIFGRDSTLSQQAWFFSKAAVVTFGGAYAVLAYMNQAAVVQYGWVTTTQMVTGLGLAESTPGPLIMVTEFVGFVGSYQHPGSLDPLVAGVLGAIVATWATFAPCFLWIFLGAPFIEQLRGNQRLAMGLTTITAAVVGVVLNLAVWFAVNTLFTTRERTPDPGWPRSRPRLVIGRRVHRGGRARLLRRALALPMERRPGRDRERGRRARLHLGAVGTNDRRYRRSNEMMAAMP